MHPRLITAPTRVPEDRRERRDARLLLDALGDAAQLRLAAPGSGVPLEDIARLVGRSGPAVTEAVHRKRIRPVLRLGTAAMDSLFAR